ncbi:MAG: hypothetical protein AMXMBFR34_28760 [Myxococcaceae bacterium]
MSRIGSMVNQAKKVAQQAEVRASDAKKDVEQKAQAAKEQLSPRDAFEAARSAQDAARKRTSRDTFGGARGLYDAGQHKPGRQTWERTVTLGRGEDIVGTDSAGPYEDRVLSGVRANVFAQKAQTVVSAGGDVFAGGKHETYEVDSEGTSKRSLLKLGAEASGAVYAGTVIGFQVGAQAGAELKEKTVTRSELGNGRQLQTESTVQGNWGAVANVGAQVGTVMGAKVELVAGVRGLGEERVAITEGDRELAGVAGRFGVIAGVGVVAGVEAGVDVDERQVRVSGDAGAALGVGAQVGGEVTIGGSRRE